jgi:hypothetical protein
MKKKMVQSSLFKPLPVWDAVEDKPYDAEHQRALEGLPFFWKLSWGYEDMIIFDCGHAGRFWVERLEDPKFKPECPYKKWSDCNG